MKTHHSLALKVLIATLFAVPSMTMAAKSSRRIQQEDLGAGVGKKEETATVVSSGGYSGQAAYTPAATPVAVAASPTPFPFTPPAGASPEVLTQAIQSFMQYLTGVDQSGNAQGFPDWVNPATVAAGQRAPALPSITGAALDSNCGGLPASAVDMMKSYLHKCGGNLNIVTGKVAITDFSTNTPSMYILDSRTLECVGSTRVTYGVGSHSSTPRAGNGFSSHQTPAGFHVTKPHHGRLYQEWNSVGIAGMGSENSNTAGRGVIIHPSNGHTLGCIGIPPSRFATVKSAIAYGSVVLNYYPGQIGSSQNRCPAYSSAAAPKAGVR